MAETIPANTAANHDAQPAGANSHWVRGWLVTRESRGPPSVLRPG
jgi:hypothetical protein